MKQTQQAEKVRTRRNHKTETKTQTIDMSDNKIFEVLEDESLTSEEQEQKLFEMITLNTESSDFIEGNKELITQLKNNIKQVLNQFAEHNKRSIELTRDNPLSKLSSGIKEVFDNYHEMSDGRNELKSTLKTVDVMLRDMGGEDKLVAAMLEAKGRAKELSSITEKLTLAKEAADEANRENEQDMLNVSNTSYELSMLEGGFFSFLKSAEINTLKDKLSQQRGKLDSSYVRFTKANKTLSMLTDQFNELESSKDFAVHKKILAILDIGDDSFKEKLAKLAGVTLQYIDDTKDILTNVRDQLETLLVDVDSSLDVNVNIRERMTILSSALVKANDASIENLSSFKEKASNEDSSLANLENEKINRIADDYIAELADTMTSTGMINAEVQKIEVVIMSLRDQLKNGLLDANEQLLISVNNATASGMVMMNKAQTLGTLAQAVVAKGQYMKETEETYGDLAEQFRSQLAVRQGRNDTLDSMTDVLHSISESLEDTNDDNAGLISDQRNLVLDVNEAVDRLRDAAETARSLQSSAKVGDYAD